jgi:streptogramin lyase
VVTTLELTEACGLAADDENLWVTSPALGAVLRYDVATLERQSSVEVGELVFAVRIGEDAVWAFGEAEGGATWRISPDGSEVTATVETPGAGDIVLGFDSVWVSARDLQVIYRIDQATAELTDTIEVDGAIAGIGVGPDALWVTGFGNGAVYRIDPDTNAIAGTFDTGLGNLGPPIVAFDSVWTSALDANLVLRLDPEAIRD